MAKKTEKPDPEIGVEAAAVLLGINPQELEAMARQGEVPVLYRGGSPPGGSVFFRARDLREWLREQTDVKFNGDENLLVSPRKASVITGLPIGALDAMRTRGTGPKFVKLGDARQARVYYSRVHLEKWAKETLQTDMEDLTKPGESIPIPDFLKRALKLDQER